MVCGWKGKNRKVITLIYARHFKLLAMYLGFFTTHDVSLVSFPGSHPDFCLQLKFRLQATKSWMKASLVPRLITWGRRLDESLGTFPHRSLL